MLSAQARLNKAYENAKRVPFDDTSKFILFSDCHRGDNSWADDFANNRNIYFHALKHYFNHGFTYCELGDGNELWENLTFEPIFEAHKNVFLLMQRFHEAGRLHLMYGNHDMVYKNKAYIKKHLASFIDPKENKQVSLMPDLEYHEAVVLQHAETGQEIFMTHGHQADFMNHHGWRFNRFLVRVLWKPLQVVGISDPTSPAKNFKELIKVERRVKKWIISHKNRMTIIGHTHRPRFPEPGDIAFFNDGSCVHPRSITGLEIEEGKISLIKWRISTTDDGILKIERVLLEGPQRIQDYITD